MRATVHTSTSLISACARRGDSAGAARWFDRFGADGVDRNIDVYNTMLDACARSGDLAAARRYLEQLAAQRLEPDEVIFGRRRGSGNSW